MTETTNIKQKIKNKLREREAAMDLRIFEHNTMHEGICPRCAGDTSSKDHGWFSKKYTITCKDCGFKIDGERREI